MRNDLIRISTKGMSREEWLAERRKAIGGSDTSAILGLNPYATPYTVWADKTGRLPEKEDTEAMRIGRDLEQYVTDRFAEKSNKRTRKLNAIIKNPAYPWASANIDRDIVGEDSGLECKTTSVLNLSKFKGGEFPLTYYSQATHYLAITGCSRWYVAVLVLGQGFMIYQMTRIENDPCPEWCESSVYVSDAEIAALMAAERDFWEFVKNDTPPALSGEKADSDALGAIYTGGDADTVNLLGMTDILERRAAIKNRIAELETGLAECEQEIKQAMGNAERGQASGYIVSWKPQTRSTFDAKRFAKENPDVDLSGYYNVSHFRKFDVKALAE